MSHSPQAEPSPATEEKTGVDDVKNEMPAAVRVASEKEVEGYIEEIIDLFEPLPSTEGQRPEANRVLTIRAVVLGCVLGTLVNASNLYLGEPAARPHPRRRVNPGTLPSPRYWHLWPGIMTMLFASVGEIFSLYKVIYKVTKASLSGLRLPNWRSASQLFRKSEAEPLFEGDQPVPWWIWLPAVVILIVVSRTILALPYQMGIGETLVTLILGFIFAFLGVQCQGAADQSPTTAIAKVGPLVIGGMSNVHNTPALVAQRINLAAAQISGGSTYAAVELISDLRVGYLLGTPVPQQIITQAAGNLIAILLSPLIFILFSKAYPCILSSGDPTCEFQVPAAAAWGSLAKVVTSADFPVPKGSAIWALVMGIIVLLVVLFKNFYLVGERTKYRNFVPNLPVIGLAFVTPFAAFNMTMAAGAIAGYIWKKKDPRRYEAYVYSLAAGAVAGEGIGGVVNAILELAKVGGSKYGSNLACPLDSC